MAGANTNPSDYSMEFLNTPFLTILLSYPVSCLCKIKGKC